jgi:LytR cell envelope-related transcriptional attenuator
MAKRQPHMSAAPAYIVYGHRHAVRLVTRIIAIGLLLAAIATVFFGIVWQHGGASGNSATATAASHGGAAVVVTHTRTGGAAATTPAANTTSATPPATHKKLHRPAKPIPLPGKTPVMVLNSNGIHGAAHLLAAKVQGYGYPITYVGNASSHGLPTLVQYAKGYGPAARLLAKKIGNVQYITPFDGINSAQARGAKLVVILGT